jgi:single-strand DNA-binding protein
MQNNVNLVVIQGNLTKDPECKDINGTLMCNFTIASNKVYKDIKDTCFIDVKCWGNKSSVVERFLTKGSPVLIEGRIQQEKWTSPEGNERSKHIILLENLTMLPSQKKKTKDNAMSDDRDILF